MKNRSKIYDGNTLIPWTARAEAALRTAVQQLEHISSAVQRFLESPDLVRRLETTKLPLLAAGNKEYNEE